MEKDDLLKWHCQIKKTLSQLKQNNSKCRPWGPVADDVQHSIWTGYDLRWYFPHMHAHIHTHRHIHTARYTRWQNHTCKTAAHTDTNNHPSAQIGPHKKIKKKRLQRSFYCQLFTPWLQKLLHHAWNEVMQRSKRSSHIPLYNACVCGSYPHYDLICKVIPLFDALTGCAVMCSIRELSF